MSLVKLKNAPLKEVIFELHWNSGINNSGAPFDQGFDLAQGKFADKLSLEFPKHKKLIPEGIPFRIFDLPIHQYWKADFQWPVIQHGQGMAAVNEIKEGYQWDTFQTLIVNTVKKLQESYEDELIYNRLVLQYINAFDLDGETTANDFMIQNLQTKITTEYQLPGSLKGFNLLQRFDLVDSSIMELSIANGSNQNNQKESVVWTTTVTKQASLTFDSLSMWLDIAHEAASDIFKKMLKTEFYASLDR